MKCQIYLSISEPKPNFSMPIMVFEALYDFQLRWLIIFKSLLTSLIYCVYNKKTGGIIVQSTGKYYFCGRNSHLRALRAP